MANNSNNIEGEGSTSRKDPYDVSSRKTRHYGMTGSVQYGLSVTQAHTRSHALQSCWFPVGGFHPQGTETELLRCRANQQPPTAASPGGCGRPRWEPGVDAPDDPKGPARLLRPLDFPGKNTGMGCHFLLQGIFPTQGWNPGLLHCKQSLYCLLKKDMATHSSTLAWKIPWTKEPGRLQSIGSQAVRHDWATSVSSFSFLYCLSHQERLKIGEN